MTSERVASSAAIRVFVLGDSISIHYGPHLKRLLPARFTYDRKGGDEALLDLDKMVGANGGDSAMVLAWLVEQAARGGVPADLLLLNCGLHDIKTDPVTGKKQVPIADYERNLQRIIACVRAKGPELVWVRTTPCDERIHNARQQAFHRFAADCEAYNAAADRVMATAAVPVIDLHGFTQRCGSDLYCDHVHLYEFIRIQQAAYMVGWLDAWSR